jgi:hypothetical protein
MKFVFLALCLYATGAYGASMDYCRPYAAQTSQLLVTYAWNRAYTYCLNQDIDPLVPETREGAFDIISPTPATPIPPMRAERVGDVPATGPLDTETTGESGFTPHSKEWDAYCKKHWPASFRAKDGTVIRHGSKRKRTPCPA